MTEAVKRGLQNLLPEDEYAAFEVLTDGRSGISALYTRHWNRAAGKWFCNMQALYGYAAAITLQGHCITTVTT